MLSLYKILKINLVLILFFGCNTSSNLDDENLNLIDEDISVNQNLNYDN